LKIGPILCVLIVFTMVFNIPSIKGDEDLRGYNYKTFYSKDYSLTVFAPMDNTSLSLYSDYQFYMADRYNRTINVLLNETEIFTANDTKPGHIGIFTANNITFTIYFIHNGTVLITIHYISETGWTPIPQPNWDDINRWRKNHTYTPVPPPTISMAFLLMVGAWAIPLCVIVITIYAFLIRFGKEHILGITKVKGPSYYSRNRGGLI